MWVGVHTKPCGTGAAAMLKTLELANEYRNALLPIYEKRYGNDTEIVIVNVQGSFNKKGMKEFERHNAIVRARIDTENFAPNKNVNLQLNKTGR